MDTETTPQKGMGSKAVENLSEIAVYLKEIVMKSSIQEDKEKALSLLEKLNEAKSYLEWANKKLSFYAKRRAKSGGGSKRWRK